MDHSYFKDRVSAYYDQDLPLQELELMRRHIAECEECQSLLAGFAKLDRLIEQKSGLSDSAVYWEESARKIEARLSDRVQPAAVTDIRRSGWSGLWWKASSVAAAVLVVGFVALHKFEILEDAGQPGVAQSTQPPAIEHEREGERALRPDSMKPIDQDAVQTIEVERTGREDRMRRPETKPQAVAVEETEVVQKARKQKEQSISVQTPTAEGSTKKTAPAGMSVEVLDEKLLPEESLAVPKLSETQLTPKKPAEGTLKIRGGRSGEVEYVVDSVKEEELDVKVDTVPTITVQGEFPKEAIHRTAPQSELGEEVIEKEGRLISDSVLATKLKVPDSAKTTKKGVADLAAEAIKRRSDLQLNSINYGPASRQLDSSYMESIKEALSQIAAERAASDSGRSLNENMLNSYLYTRNSSHLSKLSGLDKWRQLNQEYLRQHLLIVQLAIENTTPHDGAENELARPEYVEDPDYVDSFDISRILMLEAHYNICRLTSDKNEFSDSYRFISDIAHGGEAVLSETATAYQQTLDSLNRFGN